MDLDIDAVSLASYAFDKSGRYIIHSPLANIDSFELLKASQKLPFPTGKLLEIDGEPYDYSQVFDIFEIGNGSKVKLKNDTPENLIKLGNFIRMCNRLGYIPRPMEESQNLTVNTIKQYVNKHNNYINESKNVAQFAKNYVTSAMYDIGMSPANLIISQQAMDSITAPLKNAAEATLKAMEISQDNPGSFTTNVHGFVQNMDGKQGVGICAVGLKSFFAATARYNEVLAHGTPNEVARLESDVFIAKKRFRILANTYTTNEVNKAILGEIMDQLDQGTDAAIVLSALLSLATD